MSLLPVSEALQIILSGALPLPVEHVPIPDAHGRPLAEDLAARRTQPPVDVSAMDGYAVRAADITGIPTDLKLIGEIAAGRPFMGKMRPGETLRIFTGGEMPEGADTVVVQEQATEHDGTVIVMAVPTRGRHVRTAGLDFRQGDVLLRRGRVLTGRDLALAAAMNHAAIPVHRKPRVALLATGDELIAPGSQPGPGQIVYSNGYSVGALARQQGAELTDLGVVPDKLENTIDAIRQAREMQADVLVTIGGASVGEYDLVKQALAAEGLDLSFWKIAMRPGRPLMHGRFGRMHVLGLPGNPVSAFVCAFLFLVPLLRVFAGHPDVTHPAESALVGSDLGANDERADYLRARLSRTPRGQLVATPFPVQDSSMSRVLAEADCLIVREPHAPPVAAGSPCVILKLPF